MTEAELKAVRDLVYTANSIAIALQCQPYKTALQLVGLASEEGSELDRLLQAINIAGRLVHPSWGHRHADERTAQSRGSAGREPEYLRDGSAVYLNGSYTFDELTDICLDTRLKVRTDEDEPAPAKLAEVP